METEKIIGIVLLIAGLALIGYTLFLSFLFFTGSAMPPEIFIVPISESSSIMQGISQDNFEDAIPQLLENFLPSGTIPQMLNFAIWSVFAGVLIFAGSQISSLGVKLMKK